MRKDSQFEHPSVTVDVLIFTIVGDELKVLLVKRAIEPFKNMWSMPGGFIKNGESLDKAVWRVLTEKTPAKDVYLEQLYTFGDPQRDPRDRVVTVSYFALISAQNLTQPTSRGVSDIAWFPVQKLPDLAFDHQQIIQYGLNRLKSKAGYSNIVYGLLPNKFRLSALQKIYEIILGKLLDKRNFRKKMLSFGLLEPTGEKELAGAHRPAMLYQFKKREVVFFD